MEAAAFSPGPWEDQSMEFTAGQRCVVRTSSGRSIDVADPRDRKTDLEDRANARLVAAAPDLAGALEKAIAAAHEEEWYDMPGLQGAAWQAMNEALELVRNGRGHGLPSV